MTVKIEKAVGAHRCVRPPLEGLQVNAKAMEQNLATYGPFAGIERLLMGLAKAGADRQEMHENLRQHALRAWEALQAGQPNPLVENISRDQDILKYLPEIEVRDLLKASQHLGDAPQRARKFAEAMRLSVVEA